MRKLLPVNPAEVLRPHLIEAVFQKHDAWFGGTYDVIRELLLLVDRNTRHATPQEWLWNVNTGRKVQGLPRLLSG